MFMRRSSPSKALGGGVDITKKLLSLLLDSLLQAVDIVAIIYGDLKRSVINKAPKCTGPLSRHYEWVHWSKEERVGCWKSLIAIGGLNSIYQP